MERKYYCNESMRFNLDSMIAKVHCIAYDMEDGVIDKAEICGGTYTLDNIDELLEELDNLEAKAFGKVTGKEYGRIKAIAEERKMMRYATCLAKGMDERDAALAFM